MAYERAQVSILLDHLEEAPERLIVVTGPRQTGKTTLVRQALGRAGLPHRYLPVDEPEPVTLPPFPRDREDTFALSNDATIPIAGEKDARWLVRQWERARLDAERSERVFVLAFDEVRKIPGWSEAVKGLWDADRRDGRRLHVILLGSAPLLMQRGMSESLAGRYETIRVPHWSFSEMSAAFDFDLPGYVYFGGYPGAARLVREQDRWRAYVTEALVEPNIERDILAMQRVDKPSLLKRLFELGAEYSGQVLSYNKMLGQLRDAGNTTTLARYLDLLESAGLIAGLPKYAKGAHLRRGSSPKLNVLDTALMSALSGYTFEEARADRSFWGWLVESAVGAHLFNSGAPEIRLHYWRNNGREVDFVLVRGRRLVAVKVRSGPRRESLSGLAEFGERFDVAASRRLLVGDGGIPLSEFLSTPAREWFEMSGPMNPGSSRGVSPDASGKRPVEEDDPGRAESAEKTCRRDHAAPRGGKPSEDRKMKDESANAHATALPETELWLPPAGWTRKEYELDRERGGRPRRTNGRSPWKKSGKPSRERNRVQGRRFRHCDHGEADAAPDAGGRAGGMRGARPHPRRDGARSGEGLRACRGESGAARDAVEGDGAVGHGLERGAEGDGQTPHPRTHAGEGRRLPAMAGRRGRTQ